MAKPLNEFMLNTLTNLGSLISELKIVGEPLYLEDGAVLLPVNKVSLGFGLAGADIPKKKNISSSVSLGENSSFGGGSVGGLSMIPEAFLYILNQECTIIWMEKDPNIYAKALDIFLAVLKKKK